MLWVIPKTVYELPGVHGTLTYIVDGSEQRETEKEEMAVNSGKLKNKKWHLTV